MSEHEDHITQVRWRVVPVPEGQWTDADLTSSELVGVSIMLANTLHKGDVYARAWAKLQPTVHQAMGA